MTAVASLQASDPQSSPVDSLSSQWPRHLCELELDIRDSKILVPGMRDYEDAVFIGNLLYRMQTPSAVVQVESIRDVQATVRLAKKYHYKVTAKNSGHSYAGYCLNRSGIVIDLSKMRKVVLDKDAMVLRLQAGALWKDAYELLKTSESWDNIIIGGQCPTVGVSGFTLGGGLSPFSRSYGLAVDNLLEMTIVTADGEIVTVTKDSQDEHERDLFWALCGGGGGNFGITVDFTSQIHKLRDPNGLVCCGELGWSIPDQVGEFKQMMKTLNSIDLPDELTIDGYWHLDSRSKVRVFLTIIFNGDWEDYSKYLAPLLSHNPTYNDVEQMQWFDWVQKTEGWDIKSMVYHHHSSFVFAEDAMTEQLTDKLLRVMTEGRDLLQSHNDINIPAPSPGDKPWLFTPKSSVHIVWDHIGGASSRVKSEATPFPWRSGAYIATVKVQWTLQSQAEGMYDFAERCKRELGPYAIDGKAAYLNYIDDTLENWQEAYYGWNYPRLQRIKKHWDPDQFWTFGQAIEGDKALALGQSNISSIEQDHVPERWKMLAVSEIEKLAAAKSPEEVLKVQESLRRQGLE